MCNHSWRSVYHVTLGGKTYKVYRCLVENIDYKRELDENFQSAKV